jgi:Leucine-rich repeat (LRR) protein
MVATVPITPESRRFSIPLPRPLWSGIAAAVLVVLAVGLSIGVPIYRQSTARRKVEQLGGWAVMRPAGPAWMQKWGSARLEKAFAEVEEIDFDFAEIRVTDADLACVERLTSLRRLDVNFQQITDAGLVHLRDLTELRILNLTGTNVTDAGLEHLNGLRNLQILHLAGTRVTDAGMVKLKTLTSLQQLSVERTPVTDAGIAELRQALPTLEVDKQEVLMTP